MRARASPPFACGPITVPPRHGKLLLLRRPAFAACVRCRHKRAIPIPPTLVPASLQWRCRSGHALPARGGALGGVQHRGAGRGQPRGHCRLHQGNPMCIRRAGGAVRGCTCECMRAWMDAEPQCNSMHACMRECMAVVDEVAQALGTVGGAPVVCVWWQLRRRRCPPPLPQARTHHLPTLLLCPPLPGPSPSAPPSPHPLPDPLRAHIITTPPSSHTPTLPRARDWLPPPQVFINGLGFRV